MVLGPAAVTVPRVHQSHSGLGKHWFLPSQTGVAARGTKQISTQGAFRYSTEWHIRERANPPRVRIEHFHFSVGIMTSCNKRPCKCHFNIDIYKS